MKERNLYFDCLRGIAIIMVVGIHSYLSESASSFELFLRQLLNVAVPVFLALTGHFAALKTKEKGNLYLKKQILKVYIPTIVMSLPIVVINLYLGLSILKQLFLLLICGLSVYYFVALVIQFYLLAPIIKTTLFNYNVRGVMLYVLISLLSVAIISYYKYICGVNLLLIVYAGPFPVWIAFFTIGVYINMRGNRDYSICLWGIGSIVFYILSCVEAYWLRSKYTGGEGIKLSSFLFSLCTIMVILSKKLEFFYASRFASDNLLTKIGRNSFFVYLFHCYVINYIAKTVFLLESWFSIFLVTLFISLVLVFILNKVLPHPYKRYIGLI